jgi:hypothetical protein
MWLSMKKGNLSTFVDGKYERRDFWDKKNE